MRGAMSALSAPPFQIGVIVEGQGRILVRSCLGVAFTERYAFPAVFTAAATAGFGFYTRARQRFANLRFLEYEF